MWAHFEIRMFSSRHMKCRNILVHFESFPPNELSWSLHIFTCTPSVCIWSSNRGIGKGPTWGCVLRACWTMWLSLGSRSGPGDYCATINTHALHPKNMQSWATVVNSCKQLCPETRQRKHLRIQMGKLFWFRWSNVFCHWQDYVMVQCMQKSRLCHTIVCVSLCWLLTQCML